MGTASFSPKDLKELEPHEWLAYGVVIISPIAVMAASVFAFFPEVVDDFDKNRPLLYWILGGVGGGDLTFLLMAYIAIFEEVEQKLRARIAFLVSAPFFLFSALLGVILGWSQHSIQSEVATCVIGIILMGYIMRGDTVDLEKEVSDLRRKREPPLRRSHFYWARREEIFRSLRPTDWSVMPNLPGEKK